MNLFIDEIQAIRWIVVALSLGISSCKAEDVPTNWQVDCVGRMQLSFPEAVDVAANSAQMLESEYQLGSQVPRYEFADGQHADWSGIGFLGRIFVSHRLSSVERSRLALAAKQDVKQSRKWALSTKVDDAGNPLVFEYLNVQPYAGEASRVNSGYGVSLFVNDHLVRLSSSGVGTTWTAQKSNFDALLAGVALRNFGAIPHAPGVCLPYAFIRDDGQQWRNIAMTYRLRTHPDITVLLKDANAATLQPHERKDTHSAEYRSDDFWGQYRMGVKEILPTPPTTSGYQSVRLAGQKGLASFVQITRKDGVQDYGYLAVAPGDAKAKEDTPDLMLYVIQDSKNAKSKGIDPMKKEAFIELAQTIAASVKRRPVGQ